MSNPDELSQKRSIRDWLRVMTAAVVPVRVRRSVVRVDVARTIVRAIVQVAATPHGTNRVRVHEVRRKHGKGQLLHITIPLGKSISDFLCGRWKLIDYNVFR